jgi:hypothetical protein
MKTLNIFSYIVCRCLSVYFVVKLQDCPRFCLEKEDICKTRMKMHFEYINIYKKIINTLLMSVATYSDYSLIHENEDPEITNIANYSLFSPNIIENISNSRSYKKRNKLNPCTHLIHYIIYKILSNSQQI